MSNSNRRRKRDCKVLNRRELYEKYIPHISRDFAKIIDKSKNNEFKQRCLHLFKVDDPSKIQEAMAAQLFKLTLGNQSNVNVSQNTQENRGQQSIDQSDIQSCFGDLADHIDDDQWPSFNENSSFHVEKMPQENTYENCSTIQDTVVRLPPEKGKNGYGTSATNYKSTEIATSVNSDDDNFNSLELHAMFDETPWQDTATGYQDQRVPCGSMTGTMETIPQYYQPVLQHKSTSRAGSARPDSIAVPFASISRTIKETPQYYQPVLQQCVTSREGSALPDKSVVPYGSISTIKAIPQYCHQVFQQLDTSRDGSALPDKCAVPCGNTSSTIETIPQYYQPVLQHRSTSREGSALTDSDDCHFETLGNLF